MIVGIFTPDVLSEPNGALARVLSLVPFFASFATPLRYSITPLPWTELAASAAATLLGVAGVVWVAGRIYRVGILAYGKRPTVGELVRWIRTT